MFRGCGFVISADAGCSNVRGVLADSKDFQMELDDFQLGSVGYRQTKKSGNRSMRLPPFVILF
jgi:hypothetical protein